MYEIDCSELPDELSNAAINAAEDVLSRTRHNTRQISVLRNSKLVTLNGNNAHIRKMYGSLRQAMVVAVEKQMEQNYEKYTDQEYEQYRKAVKPRKV